MRILKIYDGDYPWDVRVEKIVNSLVAAGHKVRLLCRNRSVLPRREVLADRFEVVRLPPVAGSLSFPFFLNPLWVAAVRSNILSFQPDQILVRDLPLAPLAVTQGRRARIPVVADLAEPYPDSLRSQWRFQGPKPFDLLVRNPALADWVEKWVLKRVKHVLVVCPEAGARLEKRGLARDKWTEVGNTPDLGRFVPLGSPVPAMAREPGQFLMLFTGILAGDRGLDTTLEALSTLASRFPGRFRLVVVGEGPVGAELEEQTNRLGLTEAVHFSGWVEHRYLPDYIEAADAGLLPFHACAHINSTLANKLFDYMALGLPVIAADVPPMRRILVESQAGITFRSGDPEDLAAAVEAFADDTKLRSRCASSGRQVVRNRYSWGEDSSRLVAALERLQAQWTKRSIAPAG